MSKTRISYSGADTFKECPQKFWNQKTHKMRSESSAFGFGSAFESGVEVLLEGGKLEDAIAVFQEEWHTKPENRWEGQKQLFDSEDVFFYQSDFDSYLFGDEEQKLLSEWYQEIYGKTPQVDVVEWAEKLWKDVADGNAIDKKDTRFMHRTGWLCHNLRGPLMIAAFQRDILPQIEEVIDMQKEILVENDEGDEVTGYIDFIVKLKNVTGKVIMDLKSAGKFYEEHDVLASDQLGIYALSEGIRKIGYWVVLKKIQYEVKCDKCGHIRDNGRLKNCAVDKCKGKYTIRTPYCGTQILTRDLTDEFLESIKRDYSEVLMAIKNKLVWKNKKSCFNFGTRCEFYDHCWKNVPLDELATVKKKGE